MGYFSALILKQCFVFQTQLHIDAACILTMSFQGESRYIVYLPVSDGGSSAQLTFFNRFSALDISGNNYSFCSVRQPFLFRRGQHVPDRGGIHKGH